MVLCVWFGHFFERGLEMRGRLLLCAAAFVGGFGFVAGNGLGTEAQAQTPRFVVEQSKGAYPIRNVSVGGRFIPDPTNERIRVPGGRELRVMGYTDRAARKETVITTIDGTGSAHVTVTYCPEGSNRVRTIFQGWLRLPAVVPQTVSPNATFDNITVSVQQNGRVTSRRLPIGSRP
jgi:hypothetical protein